MKQSTVMFGKNFKSSFLSSEKDTEIILQKLFIDSRPYSEELVRLLVINNKDCLSDRVNQKYIEKVQEMTLDKLIDEDYLSCSPKLEFQEGSELKSHILLFFDNFFPNGTNLEFRNCTVSFIILCPTSAWTLNNYQSRPMKIMGYIDGILNETKLSGIGTLNFLSAINFTFSEDLAGYILTYSAVHGSDDLIEAEEDED